MECWLFWACFTKVTCVPCLSTEDSTVQYVAAYSGTLKEAKGYEGMVCAVTTDRYVTSTPLIE